MKLILKRPLKKDIDYERLWLMIAGLSFTAFQLFLKDAVVNFSCPFKKLTGFPCLSCGVSRALSALFNLNPVEAFFHNPLMTCACLLTCLYLAYSLTAVLFSTRRIRIDNGHRTLTRTGRILVFSLLVTNWAYLIIRGE